MTYIPPSLKDLRDLFLVMPTPSTTFILHSTSLSSAASLHLESLQKARKYWKSYETLLHREEVCADKGWQQLHILELCFF